tara:strand:- start:399 stop:836 length:438 start_codon:yes stop_codon:yes gene_type:complete
LDLLTLLIFVGCRLRSHALSLQLAEQYLAPGAGHGPLACLLAEDAARPQRAVANDDARLHLLDSGEERVGRGAREARVTGGRREGLLAVRRRAGWVGLEHRGVGCATHAGNGRGYRPWRRFWGNKVHTSQPTEGSSTARRAREAS